jgi:hypothetical protein
MNWRRSFGRVHRKINSNHLKKLYQGSITVLIQLMKILLPAILLISAFSARAQAPYTKVLYDQNIPMTATAIAPAPAKSVLMVGNYDDQNSSVILLDSTGTGIWSKSFNSPQNGGGPAYLYDIIPTSDQRYVIAGRSYNYIHGSFDAYCLKIDASGDTLWTTGINSFPNNGHYEATTVIETIDSNYLVAGNTVDGGMVSVVLLDEQGIIQWSNTFSAAQDMVVKAIRQAPDSSFYLVGDSGLQTGSPDGFLIHLSPTGALLSATTYLEIRLLDFDIHPAGLFIYYTDALTNSGLMKTDETGVIAWAKAFGSNYDFENHPKLLFLSDSTLAMLNGSHYMGELAIMDTSGAILHHLSLQLNAQDLFRTADKGLLIAGHGPLYGIKSLVTQSHIGVIKTDSLFQSPLCMNDLGISTPQDQPVNTATLALTSTPNDRIQRALLMETDTLTFLTYSGCVDQFGGLGENNLNDLVVYPNTSTGIFHFEQEIAESFRVSIYNAFGQIIGNTTSQGISATVDISGNAAGVYFYKVVYTDQRTISGKLILTK